MLLLNGSANRDDSHNQGLQVVARTDECGESLVEQVVELVFGDPDDNCAEMVHHRTSG